MSGQYDDSMHDIIFISETWLAPSCPDSLLLNKFPYAIHRLDRQNGERGGGVTIITHNRINSCCIRVTLPNIFYHLEIVCFDVIDNNFKNRFIVVYCTPQPHLFGFIL